MFQNDQVFSKNDVYQNPETKEYASLFTHNIKCTLVTDTLTISGSGGKLQNMLIQMGYTNKLS